MPLQGAPSWHAMQVLPSAPQPALCLPPPTQDMFSAALAQTGTVLQEIPPPGSQTAIPKYSERHTEIRSQEIQVPTQGPVFAQEVQPGIPMNMARVSGNFVWQRPSVQPQGTPMPRALVAPAAAGYNGQPGQTFPGSGQISMPYFLGDDGQMYQPVWIPINISEVFLQLAFPLSLFCQFVKIFIIRGCG